MNYYALRIQLTKLHPTRKEPKTKEKLLIAANEPLNYSLIEKEITQQFGHGFTYNVLIVSQISQQDYQSRVAIHDKH